MGEIRISDESGEERFVTGHLDGVLELRIRDGRPRLVVPADATLSPTDVDVVVGEVGTRRTRLVASPWWTLYLPTVLGAVLVADATLGLFDLLGSGRAGAVETTLAVVFVLAAWAGTYVVVRDADELRAADADWQPAAWPYVAGGGAVTTAYVLWTAEALPAGLDLLPVVLGAAVIGVATAAAVTGPLYLHRRRQRVGLD